MDIIVPSKNGNTDNTVVPDSFYCVTDGSEPRCDGCLCITYEPWGGGRY